MPFVAWARCLNTTPVHSSKTRPQLRPLIAACPQSTEKNRCISGQLCLAEFRNTSSISLAIEFSSSGSDACTRLNTGRFSRFARAGESHEKSNRIVPGSATFGNVAPQSLRTFLGASFPSNTAATHGPELMCPTSHSLTFLPMARGSVVTISASTSIPISRQLVKVLVPTDQRQHCPLSHGVRDGRTFHRWDQ